VIVSAAAEAPNCEPTLLPPAAPPPVLHEVVDPADKEAVSWVCDLLRTGRADLYAQDEADLSLLPTLSRPWMPRGEQLRVPAPGTNQKCSVSATIDLAEGWLWWFSHPKRSAVQFGVTLCACARRSQARGRLAVLLVDNAPSHQPGKTGILRRFLNALAGQVVLVFQPKYSPESQPTERLWLRVPFRAARPNVTHNHTRGELDDLVDDSDRWLARMAAAPATVLTALGLPAARSYISMAA
jgi:DDE superfamily endonuclease